ncbi:hypothetical protein [Hyphococcus sp.]|jgi:hypothetical protein|uniref:hypothetical protein n=1 Tax=Hyphococcus sp. TaxID=2038636 RepID=UPI003D121A21
MSETPLSYVWGTPFRAARAFDNALEVASYASKAALVSALTAPIPFYWNPPFWTIALMWPKGGRASVVCEPPSMMPIKESCSDGYANDNNDINVPMAA